MTASALSLPAVPLHGGPDALGLPVHDLSSNANACGPFVPALAALRAADARHYPDPAYTQLCVQLAAWHGVAPQRILPGASGSELIQRLTLAVALCARQADGAAPPGTPHAMPPAVWLPAHAYGDYARAAQAASLPLTDDPAQAALLWACDPSSPLGQPQPGLAGLVAALRQGQTLALDMAYDPLRLHGALALDAAALERTWRILTPNKALGLTGVRAAYAIAPRQPAPALLARMRALAPSWPLGAHGVALLQHWASRPAQDWLQDCRASLRQWRARQAAALQAAGWPVLPGVANFMVAAMPLHMPVAAAQVPAAPVAPAVPAVPAAPAPSLATGLRVLGFKLRDCASFGLPGHARIAVAPPPVQDSLLQALSALGASGPENSQKNSKL